MKTWKLLSSKPVSSADQMIEVLLTNRKIQSKQEKDEFLNPPKPSQLSLEALGIDRKEVQKAISRIREARKNGESVVIYTDYDVDGVSGGTIVWEVLHQMNIKVMPYIPHRATEGYGLSRKGIDNVLKQFNPKLIITVDHGITARDKIKYAGSLGIDVIVIDHHVRNSDPEGLAIIHTTRLCATGVAWAFTREIIKDSEKYLDLVALATIADLVPMIGPNRSLVKFGLEKLNTTKRIGLNAVFEAIGLRKGTIGTFEVGFMIAPRINAMGRLFHALDSMRLLCTPDENRASSLAAKLNEINKERQNLTEDTITHARQLFESNGMDPRLVFIAHDSYNPGILGLVAGKMVELYYRPSVVISKGPMYSKASARSIEGINIIETIREAQELLEECGGHPMAAGFTIKTENIDLLRTKLEKIIAGKYPDHLFTPTLSIDSDIEFAGLNENLYRILSLFSPFGVGNPEPVFRATNVRVFDIQKIGKMQKHLKMKWKKEDKGELEMLGWNLGKLHDEITRSASLDVAYSIHENSWNGIKRLQMHIRDVKMNPEKR